MQNKLYKPFFILSLLALFLYSSQVTAQELSDSELLQEANIDELQQIIDSYEGEKAVLINMWATWCGPCVEEFPHIVELQRKYDERLQVIFVSADFEKGPAINFLREQGVDWTTYFKTGKDQEFITKMSSEWSGAMPFTKILDVEGNLVSSWENKADFDTFESNVKQALNP